MGLFDRAVLVLYTLSLLLLSLAGILVSTGWTIPIEILSSAAGTLDGRLAIGLPSAVFFIVSLRFLYFGFRRPRPQAIIHNTDLGEVRVALAAVENLVNRVARHVPGVREVKPSVGTTEGRLWIKTQIIIASDVGVPDVSSRLQHAIQAELREIIGVEVDSIRVAIDNFSDESRRGRMDQVGKTN